MTIDEALSAFLQNVKLGRLGSVQTSLHEALGRVTAEDILSEEDLPPFDRSAVDGYAVKAHNTFGASSFSPKVLQLTKEETIDENEARQVWTGNPLPKGSDAVLMLEYTKRVEDQVEVWNPVTPGENISKRGEDIQRGEVAIKKGTRLKPHHIGLLAALRITHISIVEKPKVAILSTGSELVELGHKPQQNQIIDVNRLILSGMCLELGAEPLDLGIAKDDLDEISAKIQEGLKKAYVIVTTGGTSVGYTDVISTAINQLGAPGVIAHGIAMRPGMPTALAILQNKPVVVLSGNPVAAMVGFEVFARPVLLRLLGVDSEPRPMVKARLTRRVPSALGKRVFLRVHSFERGEEFFAEPVRVKGAGVLTTMTKANGYVIIPENREGLEEDEIVTVHLFDKMGGA